MKQIQFTHIKNLIATGKIEEALVEFEKVISNTSSTYENMLITLGAEAKELKNNYIRGVIIYDEYQRQRNKLTYRSLELLNQVWQDLREKKTPLRKEDKHIADPIGRQEMLGLFAKELWEAGEYGIVRQRAAFSSFAIPNREVSDPIWIERDGNDSRASHHYKSSWAERKWFELHAKATYCRLIIKPSIARKIARNRGKKAAILRLKCLQEFVEVNKDKVDIVSTDTLGENIIILGNWFISKSSTPTDKGYENTSFEWENSLVEKQIQEFDSVFYKLLKVKKMDIYESKQDTLEQIRHLIDEIS